MRVLVAGAVVVAVFVLGAIAAAPSLHSPGDADCSNLADNSSGLTDGARDSGMGVVENGSNTDCPVDDAAEMGASPASGASN